MSTTALRITTYAPTQVGSISRIKLVSQSVTGPAGADGEGAPTSATYVTLSTNATLTGERVLTAGTGITLTDAGAGDTLTIATTAVLPTLADAKGDLLVASAADTITRLAVGTNNYVLTADSAEATGVKWAAASGGGSVAQSPPKGATYWQPGLTINAQANATIATGYIYLCQIEVTETTDFTGLAVYVSSGVASSNVRLGVYNASSDWAATTVVVDSGDVATTSGGIKTYAGTFQLTPGFYYLAILASHAVALSWLTVTGGVGGTGITSTGYSHITAGSFTGGAVSYGALPANPTISQGASPSGCPVLMKVT